MIEIRNVYLIPWHIWPYCGYSWVFLNTWYSWPSQEETPPCQYRHCCVQKAFWNKYTNISVLNSNVLCGVERAFWNTHTYTRTQTYQFWLCNTPLTCQCPSQVQAAAPKIWDDGWQLYIIILSTYLSGRRLETRYHHHHRGNLLADCFHLFSFWVLAQRPQQITQLLLDNCVSMSQLERAG